MIFYPYTTSDTCRTVCSCGNHRATINRYISALGTTIVVQIYARTYASTISFRYYFCYYRATIDCDFTTCNTIRPFPITTDANTHFLNIDIPPLQ